MTSAEPKGQRANFLSRLLAAQPGRRVHAWPVNRRPLLSLRENRRLRFPYAGKSWESRFKCQALLKPHAVLSCMAYVDLNPARAAMCDTLADSDFTSIQRRLRERDKLSARIKPGLLLDRPLKPVAGLDAGQRAASADIWQVAKRILLAFDANPRRRSNYACGWLGQNSTSLHHLSAPHDA